MATISSLGIITVLAYVSGLTEHPERYAYIVGWIGGSTFWVIYLGSLFHNTFKDIISKSGHPKSKNNSFPAASIPLNKGERQCQRCRTTESNTWHGQQQKDGSWLYWCEICYLVKYVTDLSKLKK